MTVEQTNNKIKIQGKTLSSFETVVGLTQGAALPDLICVCVCAESYKGCESKPRRNNTQQNKAMPLACR